MLRVLPVLTGALPRLRRLIPTVALLVVILAGLACIGVSVFAAWQFRQGKRDISRYRFKEALEHLDSYLRVWPHSAEAHLLAAQAARRYLDFRAADKHLDEAQRILGGISDDIVLERMLLRAQNGDLDGTTTYLRAKIEQHVPEEARIRERINGSGVSG